MRAPKRVTTVWATLTAILLCCLTATSHGGETSEAKQRFDRALAHIDAGEYRQAIVELWRAYAIKPHHSVLFNIAQAHVLLHEPVQAIATLERCLEEGGDTLSPQRSGDVRKLLAEQRELVGDVVVRVSHEGAAISIDGLAAGSAPMSRPVRLRTGRHLIAASLAGHRTAEQWVRIASRGRVTVELTLELAAPAPPAHPNGQLVVTCALPGVELRIDGRPAGTTPLAVPVLATSGERRVSFRRPGYRFQTSTLRIDPAKVARADCQAELVQPIATAHAAKLTVHASPRARVSVLVDGVAGTASRRLPAGPHHVQVRRDGYEPWSLEVVLTASQDEELHAQLVPTADYREERYASSRTQRTWSYVLGGAGLALGAVTIGHLVWNDGRHGDWSDEDAQLQPQWSGQTARGTDLLERQAANDELLRSVLRADTVTVGLAIGASALLTAGVVLFVTGDDPGDYEVVAEARNRGGVLGWRHAW